MTASAPGDVRLVKLIEDAAGLIVEAQKRPHTAPYHWAGALYQAGMLVPAGEADQLQGTRDRAERLERHVNELIDRAEKAEAKLATAETKLHNETVFYDELQVLYGGQRKRADEAEAKLAAVRELLEEWRTTNLTEDGLITKLRAAVGEGEACNQAKGDRMPSCWCWRCRRALRRWEDANRTAADVAEMTGDVA